MGKSADKPGKTDQEIALGEVAEKKFEIYNKLYRPLANKSLKRTRARKGRIEEAQGIVNADVQQRNTGRDAGIAAAGLRGGITTTSNRSTLSRSTNADAVADVRGQGMALAREGVESRELRGKLNHIRLGHGIAAGTQQTQLGLASTATAQSIARAGAKLQKSEALATSLGQVSGAYVGSQEWETPTGPKARPQFASHQLDSGGRSQRSGVFS